MVIGLIAAACLSSWLTLKYVSWELEKQEVERQQEDSQNCYDSSFLPGNFSGVEETDSAPSVCVTYCVNAVSDRLIDCV